MTNTIQSTPQTEPLQRLNTVQNRMRAATLAVQSGQFVPAQPVATDAGAFQNNLQNRIQGRQTAMNATYEMLENSVMSELANAKLSLDALRKFQALQAQSGYTAANAFQSGTQETKQPDHNIIDVEAKTVVTEPSGGDSFSSSPTTVT